MIDKLEMFISLAREGHFGRAAEACGVTQPTLSSAIRALEDQLGVQLVFRGSRYQGLTAEGERVLDWARRIVADVRGMRDEVRTLRKGLSGVLRLGVIPTALPMVQRLTTALLARHPNVRVMVLSRTSAEILAGIEQFDLDAGITYLDNEPLGREPLGRIAQLPLYAEEYRLILGPGMEPPPLQDGCVTWAEIAKLPLCLLTGDMQNRRIVDHQLAQAGAAPRPGAGPAIETNSNIVLVSHVMTGTWASVMPQKLADLFADLPGLRSLPVTGPRVTHAVGLVATRRDPPLPLVAALFEAVGVIDLK